LTLDQRERFRLGLVERTARKPTAGIAGQTLAAWAGLTPAARDSARTVRHGRMR